MSQPHHKVSPRSFPRHGVSLTLTHLHFQVPRGMATDPERDVRSVLQSQTTPSQRRLPRDETSPIIVVLVGRAALRSHRVRLAGAGLTVSQDRNVVPLEAQ